MTQPMGRALIFDCDGVLVDSEILSMAELMQVIRRCDIPISESQAYDLFLGTSSSSEVRYLRDRYGVDITPALAGSHERLIDRFRAELKPIPGIADVLDLLGVPRAVASSSSMERLRLSLGMTGLWDCFAPHIYSASMVQNGKPAPDLFLLAARKLGVAPADCVVIEDSPVGIRAARAAGMRVVGFAGGSHAGPARLVDKLAALGPDALVEHAADLPDTLTRMG